MMRWTSAASILLGRVDPVTPVAGFAFVGGDCDHDQLRVAHQILREAADTQ